MRIRDAAPGDAEAACVVLRRSITELCQADHGDDPAVLAAWLANKTPSHFQAWLAQPGYTVLLAIADEQVLAVGALDAAGVIRLNYVSPDARFQGVSRALLSALEDRAAARGHTECRLLSTDTARRFYEANGYALSGPPARSFGTAGGHPMSKPLGAKP